MIETHRIYVAGHRGMVGSAIVRHLLANGFDRNQIITRSHAELDLTQQTAVQNFFEQEKPTQVYMAAAKVGGIHANKSFPAEFIYENLMVQANVIDASFRSGVKKLLFLGSSCIYPRNIQQPMSEEALLTGTLESSNEPYAIAKIAGIKLCESYNRQFGVGSSTDYGLDYRSVMPTNLYGPGDNYQLENNHVIPALIRRFHEAKEAKSPSVTIWGTGTPMREFLYVDDMAAACVHVMNLPKFIFEKYTSPMLSHLNVGYGSEVSILQLAQIITQVVGYGGAITFDESKPDGSPRKWLDSSRLNSLGWQAKVDLRQGLEFTYQDFLTNNNDSTFKRSR